LRRAERLGAERIATGHYARIDFNESAGRWRLLKGVDPDKDQSYFLYPLTQEELARTLFPVGAMRKVDVRVLAAKLGLSVAQKPESQEICFVPDDDYAAFLRARIPEAFRPGPIVDTSGRVVGRHEGLLNFTIGQRKGMGIAAPQPLYVVALDVAANTVVAGRNEDLFRSRLSVTDVNWVALSGLSAPRTADVKIRSRHEGAPGLLMPGPDGSVFVEFEKPQRAITPGQAAVFYAGDVVLGGGTIDRVLD
jgi:tRNA-specific 2-thiouridylase